MEGSQPSSPDRGGMEKSKSNAELKSAPVKKRGVYVEKQEIEDPPRPKAPRRSRPGTKKFLDSVLTILSKSTTGTQYPPEIPDIEPKPTKKQTTRQNTAKASSKNPTLSKTDIKTKNPETTKKPKKQKFKSRVLNVLNDESEKTFVLKGKQEIIQTPSTYSKSTKDDVSNPSIRWADFLPKLIDSETGMVKAPQKNLQQIDERVAKCVLEGTQLNMQKELNEPSTTLVSAPENCVLDGRQLNMQKELNEPSTTLVSAPEKDEKLYNIFVNLLETVYNEKTDDDAASSVRTPKSSKVRFEMEYTVADKLDAPDDRENLDVASKCPKRGYPSRNDEKYERNKQQLGEYYFNSMPLTVKWSEAKIRPMKPARNAKKKLKQGTQFPKTTTQSEIMQERRYYKKSKKNDLLHVLKQELSVETNDFEEPDNFFQALRVMAKNKRRSQKTIHFDVPAKDNDSEFDTGCRLKRRKVISPSKKNPKPYKEQSEYISDISPGRKNQDTPIHCYSSANSGSGYSLEVYGFDYDEKKPSMFSDYSDGETVDDGVNMIHSWNRGFRTITQVWKR